MASNAGSTQPFPESGDYPVKFWSEYWGVTPKTILDWVKKYKLHNWGPSQQNSLINAKEFREKFGGNADA